MKAYTKIASNLDSLKLKSMEEVIYRNADDSDFIIPKVIPFKGINTDMLYIRNNSILFLKFMDTTEELFSFLDEEIIEIMSEEYSRLKQKMDELYPEVFFNYVFIMPYISEIEETYGYDDFINNHIILGENAENVLSDSEPLYEYMSDVNDEVKLTMFILDICAEYFAFTDELNLSKFIKKVSFENSNTKYRLAMMDDEQITDISSANYGNHIIYGGSGTGKSTLLLGRLIKLSKIYPHHKFLLLTFTKQQLIKYREKLELLNVDCDNIEVHTFSGFIFKVAKSNNLVIDYNMIKQNYDKAFLNIIRQIKNTIKNKSMFKGIFIDEGENFSEEEIQLIHEFLYKTKRVFNVSFCKSYNINNSLNIYKCKLKAIDFEDELVLKNNYRQSKEITEFVNRYCENSNEFISNLRENLPIELFMKTNPIWSSGKNVNIIRVEDLDDQINSVIWEVQHFVNNLGYSYEDIAIVFPFNKKKLKSGKVIYFQYMLKKSLEDADIPFMIPDEDITNITPRNGVTISNIYSVKSLSYKAIVVCELEMLYNHTVDLKNHDYQINDFAGDLNKVYTAITRAEECLSIVVSYTAENSNIINLIEKSGL